MTDWAFYPRDRALHGATITASNSPGTAANTVDLDQATKWEPSDTGSAVKIYGDLGAAYNISAIVLGNTSGTSGATIQFYKGATFGALTNSLASITAGSRKNTLVKFASTSVRYWAVNFPNGVTGVKIGTISVLDDDAKLSIAAPAVPDFPSFSVDPGFAVAQLATGNPITQILGGPIRTMAFAIHMLDGTEGALYDDILESLEDNYGWARGVWVTDDSMGATQGRAWYGVPVPGQPIVGQLSPGPLGMIGVQLQILPMGVS